MSNQPDSNHILAAFKSAIDASATEAARQERTRRTELYRREAAKEINRYARHYCKELAARYNIDELQPSKVHVTLKKPKSYYEAIFEAVCMMVSDTYLLDRSIKATISELFPEVCRRAGHRDRLPDSVWYNEFSPALQSRIMKRLADFEPTQECDSLSKVSALIKEGRKAAASGERPVGRTFPHGRFQFNGNGTVLWFGNELTLAEKGKGRTLYVRVGGKYEGVYKTLLGLGVNRETAVQWRSNAEAAYSQRQEQEAFHEANLASCGTKYD
jgi:hypothetical protein